MFHDAHRTSSREHIQPADASSAKLLPRNNPTSLPPATTSNTHNVSLPSLIVRRSALKQPFPITQKYHHVTRSTTHTPVEGTLDTKASRLTAGQSPLLGDTDPKPANTDHYVDSPIAGSDDGAASTKLAS